MGTRRSPLYADDLRKSYPQHSGRQDVPSCVWSDSWQGAHAQWSNQASCFMWYPSQSATSSQIYKSLYEGGPSGMCAIRTP